MYLLSFWANKKLSKLKIKVVILSVKRGNYVNASKNSNAAHDISDFLSDFEFIYQFIKLGF